MTFQQGSSGAGEVRSVRLPRISDGPVAIDQPMRQPSPVFALLVQSEADTVGLIAYALYKQNKRDWLIAYRAKERRDPTDAETDAYTLGESMPRRLATYRRLAEDHLASNAAGGARLGLLNELPALPADGAAQTWNAQPGKPAVTWRHIAFLLAMLVAMAVVFRFAATWLLGAR
jgi:hypothetical protein